ncbi:hypothetical protein AVEN_196422-1 [Araneus ventricosus]|uniref:Uncharacterized protein n=1 Tax=Araneus ventricosus TaxID=182803 RepID=A0A4Y2AWP8_ARAVE|nr:hypothetical protein AVEN_196422-1 [Araneus ventricosus]
MSERKINLNGQQSLQVEIPHITEEQVKNSFSEKLKGRFQSFHRPDKETQTRNHQTRRNLQYHRYMLRKKIQNISYKKRKPKPSNPPSAYFLDYHRKKHMSIREKLQFRPKLDPLPEKKEELENETRIKQGRLSYLMKKIKEVKNFFRKN